MEDKRVSLDFKSEVKNAIHSPDNLLQLCMQDTDDVSENAWFLLDSVMTHLRENNIKEKESFAKYIDAINLAVNSSNSKEIYLSILEQFDPHVPTRFVAALLPSLKTTLKNLVDKDPRACLLSLDMGYSALQYYIDSMNLPEYKEFDPAVKENIEFEAIAILNFIALTLDSLKYAITQVIKLNQDNNAKEVKNFYSETFRFFCSLLSTTSKLDLQIYVENKEKCEAKYHDSLSSNTVVDSSAIADLQEACNTLMELLHMLYSPLKLITNQFWCGEFVKPRSQDEEGINAEIELCEAARGCYLYFLFCLRISCDLCPKIWSFEYLLCLCMKDIVCLISQKSPVIVHKGLELCRYIVNRLDVETLSYEKISTLTPSYADHVIDNIEEIKDEIIEDDSVAMNIVRQIYNSIITVAVFVPAKTIRSRAVEFLTKFTDKFLHSDRFIIIKYLLTTTRHAGVLGVLIHYVKEKMNAEFNNKENKLFTQPTKLKSLIEIITKLPNGTETDLLVYSDKIMPALNLLRFLLLKDEENTTQVRQLKDNMKTNFLEPLRTGLNLSRAHYEAELKNCQKNKNKSKENNKDSQPKITINGISPNLPIAQQIQTINAALTSFDMMEVVLSRVEELFLV